MARFEGWRVPVTYGTAIAAAAASSAVLITVLFLSLSKIEYSLPRFGFFAIREFHIAIRDVTHLKDMTSLAKAAPGSADSLEQLSAANDLVYMLQADRRHRDGKRDSRLRKYRSAYR
ncbi:hypothetical protein [Mesorhizobium sp.]|uniref:hypothetical protein n=1 Tax=Mesorhizobium sp. TaxID=1871066 RepID=UPI000FE55025|nr:hypothetical protein [Mesorhizobium sp.]RWP96806.1 MAG: hypothetical protein EOR89_23070 [Mesorhizobium sp.]RWQ47260.1 MAG: hypothetical protein EOS82_20405 [Mesorhizobium sp.]